MMDISKFAGYIQNVSEITSDLFDLAITIVDRNYVRVAGTHGYRDNIGKTVENPNVFRYVMEKDKSVLIKDPRKDLVCIECLNKSHCKKTTAIYAPLKVENKVVGGLAIVAFNLEQKNHILNNTRFFQFVEQLSELISGKLEAEQSAMKLENSLEKNIAILNAVHDGVIAIDRHGIIEQVNHSASVLLHIRSEQYIGKNIEQLLPNSVLDEIIKENRHFVDKQVGITIDNKKIYVFLTSHPVNRHTLFGGAVLSFKSAKEITSLAHNFTLSGTQPITFDNIIGQSTTIKSITELSKRVSISDSTVLIRGESGTGKELFARAIHNESLRSNGPFIAVNCAAIPEPLLESELFGYVEGAFTGARRGGKPGKCELAAGGTLFLDEVGDIPLFLQSKFLRMLQERTIERVGGTKTIPIDVRIIAATHRDLESMIENKEFREDLYYRINVIPIVLPPLRERRDDIYSISKHFINKYAIRMGKDITDISHETIEALRNYSWPGNIRELENSIEYAVNVETTNFVTLNSLPTRIKASIESTNTKIENPQKINDTIRAVEMNEIISAINKFGWTTTGKQAAADHLGISLATLYRWLKK
ncbi:MAG: sigma-54 factor interaction protein [Clostridia bacterium]|nr:sigma-54 factor interaction protein [Clostridia bacterium]